MSYWNRWFRHGHKPVGELGASQARQLAERGDAFTVVIGQTAQPHCFIEVNKDFYGVSFLDDRQREEVMYSFEEVEPGRLFLTKAMHREFRGNTNEVAEATVYRFQTDGRVEIEYHDLVRKSVQKGQNVVDVTGNWEAVPRFGAYACLIRRERVQP